VPVSALNFSEPLYMLSLKDLSNLPPMSNTMAGLSSAANADAAIIAVNAAVASNFLIINISLIFLTG
jgi:hypothetical protein